MTFNPCHCALPDLDELLNVIIEHPIVIEYVEGDELVHTDEHPECDDPTCYCHLSAQREGVQQ